MQESIWYTISGIVGGSGLGYLYWKFIGCRSGYCPLTSTRLGSILYGAFIGLMLSTSFGCQTGTGSGNNSNSDVAKVQNISSSEFLTKSKEPNSVILDVRTPGEYSSGHIPAALNIDYTNGFESSMASMDKTKTYLVYCQVGGRSGKATQWMVKNGFTQVYNLNGGFASWSGPRE